jgi:RHS repeat-associated protein
MSARYYDPVVGRFLSTDPELIGPGAGRSFERISSGAANMNAYTYGMNRPISLVDPTGGAWEVVGATITLHHTFGSLTIDLTGEEAAEVGNAALHAGAGEGFEAGGVSYEGWSGGTEVYSGGHLIGSAVVPEGVKLGDNPQVVMTQRGVGDKDWFHHTATFVVNGDTGAIVAQFSLRGYERKFEPEPLNLNDASSTYKDDRAAYTNGPRHVIPPPGEMSPKAFANVVIALSQTYSAHGYSNLFGPNSNSAAAYPFHVLGASVPDLARTPWLGYYDYLR